MIGILYVLHGSKKKGKGEQMEHFIRLLTDDASVAFNIPPAHQEIAFLEHDVRTIQTGLESLLTKGVSHILVQPLLLFPASHALEDIPTAIAHFEAKHSEPTIIQCHTFGRNPEIIELGLEQARNIVSEQQLNLSDTTFVIHGSKRFDQPLQEMQHLVKNLAPEITVTVIYGNQTWQSFVTRDTSSPSIIVPIFLFEGHLLDRIRSEIATFQQPILMTPTLELNPRLIPAILRELTLALEAYND